MMIVSVLYYIKEWIGQATFYTTNYACGSLPPKNYSAYVVDDII